MLSIHHMTLLLAAFAACLPISTSRGYAVADRHSHAQPEKVILTHLDLDLAVDFLTKSLIGSATWKLNRLDLKAPLVLDCREVEIESIKATKSGQALATPSARITTFSARSWKSPCRKVSIKSPSPIAPGLKPRGCSGSAPKERPAARNRFFTASRRQFMPEAGCPARIRQLSALLTMPESGSSQNSGS